MRSLQQGAREGVLASDAGGQKFCYLLSDIFIRAEHASTAIAGSSLEQLLRFLDPAHDATGADCITLLIDASRPAYGTCVGYGCSIREIALRMPNSMKPRPKVYGANTAPYRMPLHALAARATVMYPWHRSNARGCAAEYHFRCCASSPTTTANKRPTSTEWRCCSSSTRRSSRRKRRRSRAFRARGATGTWCSACCLGATTTNSSALAMRRGWSPSSTSPRRQSRTTVCPTSRTRPTSAAITWCARRGCTSGCCVWRPSSKRSAPSRSSCDRRFGRARTGSSATSASPTAACAAPRAAGWSTTLAPPQRPARTFTTCTSSRATSST